MRGAVRGCGKTTWICRKMKGQGQKLTSAHGFRSVQVAAAGTTCPALMPGIGCGSDSEKLAHDDPRRHSVRRPLLLPSRGGGVRISLKAVDQLTSHRSPPRHCRVGFLLSVAFRFLVPSGDQPSFAESKLSQTLEPGAVRLAPDTAERLTDVSSHQRYCSRFHR